MANPRFLKEGAASLKPKCTPTVRLSRGSLLTAQPLAFKFEICSQYRLSRSASSWSLEPAAVIFSAADAKLSIFQPLLSMLTLFCSVADAGARLTVRHSSDPTGTASFSTGDTDA